MCGAGALARVTAAQQGMSRVAEVQDFFWALAGKLIAIGSTSAI